MNIFILSWNVKECAKWHFDRHVVKMILELAQLLSTAHWILSDKSTVIKWNQYNCIYKQTHKNHPCAVWVREHLNNYRYIVKLALALCDEYYYRYGKKKNKQHKTRNIIEFLQNNEPTYLDQKKELPLIEPMKITKPPQAMPNEYKRTDTLESYKKYYMSDEKRHLASWSNRETPEWFKF